MTLRFTVEVTSENHDGPALASFLDRLGAYVIVLTHEELKSGSSFRIASNDGKTVLVARGEENGR
jgi:hypothetical protein